MSSLQRFSGNQGVPKGIAVYSRDMQIVKSISGALSKKNESDSATDYVVIQQTSVSSIDNVCVASVLDISMVGKSSSRVREAVSRLKIKEPTHPIFLVGEIDQLTSVMKHEGIKKVVDGHFPLPLSATEIMPALNDALDSSSTAPDDTSSEDSGFNYRYLAGAIIAITAVSYWYVTSVEEPSQAIVPAPVSYEQSGVSTPDEEQSLVSDESATVESDVSDESTASVSVISNTEPEQTSEVMESKVIPQLDEEVETVVFEPDNFVAPESEPEPLFDEYQEEILVKARDALKKGFIVGPDGSSAWHYYRQALEVNQIGEGADERTELVLSELKSEFDLAVELGKFGRSRSILRVYKDIDPLNQSISDMQASFDQRFKKAES